MSRRAPVMAGLVTLALLFIVLLLLPRAWLDLIRETAFDVVLVADQRLRRAEENAPPGVIVVEIDRRALDAVGPWPWPRETVARLIEGIAAGKPAAIAIDILFAEPDTRSPATLARTLGNLTGRSDLASLAESLPDSDQQLAQATGHAPVAFGFVLDPDRPGSLPEIRVLTRGTPALGPLWSATGAIGPLPSLVAAAGGLGALSLPGDIDGIVRRVPLLVAVGGKVQVGLAPEAVRLARQASAYLIEAEPLRLHVGDATIPLPQDGLLRLAPYPAGRRAALTLSAAEVLGGRFNPERVAGAIVLVGGSAPELGGSLRATIHDALTPSVQIQSDAVRQIMAGRVPRAVEPAAIIGLGLVGALGAVAIAAGAALTPLIGAVSIVAMIALTWIAALALSLVGDRLIDPLTPSVAAAITFAVVSVASFARTRQRETLMRRRFEQHLAPAVVSRIVQDPGALKLSGERREVTALFTDVEGFTTMTQRADPERLVAVLDEYFEGMAALAIAHGGMVDKVVGDAVHALFNAPLDLADHPRRAVECAVAIRTWAKDFRQRPGPTALGFGRTRVGVETGLVIVGDVGIRTKLDYTAHGDAMNVTARLEAANKDLGSTICIGPSAAARCDPTLLRPLGVITVRGHEGPLAVFEPWPEEASAGWRQAYIEAFGVIASDCESAAALMEKLGRERPDDPVPMRLAQRLRAITPHM